MGSLPPFPDLPSPNAKFQQVDQTTLLNLFKSQQNQLNYFFQNLNLSQALTLTGCGCGCLLVVDGGSHLIGTFTDGDLRRTLKASGEGIFKLTVGEMCNRNPRTISPDAMAVEAMKKMESPPSPVQFLPVIKDDNILIGIVTLHGLVSAGL
ncbi:hypothetical protein OIU74_019628 [Salix koriyanagi]|uniref:CBS domain-containing protein n=1 Tax=Salix koriyanagi TaxID=2511006 RepID=A0A9Q0P410_9ROSI|nr:hypothetical protein OIU74_019628 [Salix koriyanagi]